jgi:hypothetical protein
MLLLTLATHVEISSVIRACTLCCQTNDVNPDDRTIALNENFNASEVMGMKRRMVYPEEKVDPRVV